MGRPETRELRLLLACARAHLTPADKTAIQRLLADGIDWTAFVQKTIDHGLAGLIGHSLGQTASDLVPADIRSAFETFTQQIRKSNQALLDELSRITTELAAAGVKAIPFKGPVLAKQAFGDLGLRGFRDLDFLIHDQDLPRTIEILCNSGYQRRGELTPEQFDVIHRLQGQEIMFKANVGAVEPHTRLTPIKMALDIDYDGLWRRARPEDIFGTTLLTLAPEDTFVLLAIHGGKELWWDIKWACDVADFIASHPDLNWGEIVDRAGKQGCLRMLLVATSLARRYLGAKVPASIAAAEAKDRIVDRIVGRIAARWEADDPGGPPSNKTLSMDRLLLHDGIVRQASYIARTLLLPGPQHVPLAALPRRLRFLYIPIGLAHDQIALPLYRAYTRLRARFDHILTISPVALAVMPVSAETRKKLRRLQQAHKEARQELAAHPDQFVSWYRMGEALSAMKQYRQAIPHYDKALILVPDNLTVWNKRGAAVAALQKTGTLKNIASPPEFDTNSSDGWAMRAGFLSAFKRDAEAAEASDNALRLDPNNEAAIRIGIKSRILAGDWSKREADKRAAKEGSESGKFTVKPFILKLMSDSEQDCFTCTQLWATRTQWRLAPVWKGEHYRHDKLRIAYISTDFRSHPVGRTIIAPLEHHDKDLVEVTAISLHASDGSHIRARAEAAVDRFVDAENKSDAAVATMLRDLEIDIAVDLNGLTGSRRAGILARRPAPLQVNYLGYPGTMASPFFDYIIADRSALREESHAFYTEKVAYLPHSYLPYDRQRHIAERPPSRSEEGLPETGFIFACFNRLQKISPEMFDVWMRLLRAVEGSVLWITCSEAGAIAKLAQEAENRGVSPERLVFAGFKVRSEDHLARHRLADLFLDTLPYNAHSTAADALWAGLPVLTCMGQAFQARVAAGLLRAIHLPELVTTSPAEYEQLALALARNPQRLAAIREKLARNRDTTPLFDSAEFTRGLEMVYRNMWERQQAGLPPESFSVTG